MSSGEQAKTPPIKPIKIHESPSKKAIIATSRSLFELGTMVSKFRGEADPNQRAVQKINTHVALAVRARLKKAQREIKKLEITLNKEGLL